MPDWRLEKLKTPLLSVWVPAEKLLWVFFTVTDTFERVSPLDDLTMPVTAVLVVCAGSVMGSAANNNAAQAIAIGCRDSHAFFIR